MRFIKRRKRCPSCGFLTARKHGFVYRKRHHPDQARIKIVRWHCVNCQKTFSGPHSIHSFTYAKKATQLYFDGKASYRNVAKLLGIHRMTAYTHIQAVCQRAKSPLEISLELKPTWSGYLALDGNTLNVFKRHEQLMTAMDIKTRDIPNALLARHGGPVQWTHLLQSLQVPLTYPVKAVVSDGEPGILHATEAVFPSVPHQICVRHFENEMYRFLRYRPHRPRVDLKLTRRFMRSLHHVLYASTLQEYLFSLDLLRFNPELNRPELRDAISKIERNYKYLTPHFSDPSIPRTTNIIENLFSQLDSKLNPIVKFNSHETAWNTSKLLISWYRFKKFSSCRPRNQHLNGQFPLQLAGSLPIIHHWIYHAIRPS